MKMKRNKIVLFLVLLSVVFLVTGCKKDNTDVINMSNTEGTVSDNPLNNIDANGSGNLLCTRSAEMPTGIEGEFKYSINYKDGVIKILHSMEKVTSNDKSILEDYEKSYNTIKERYSDVKGYNINITKDKNSVTYDSVQYYDQINFDELIEIEGNENKLYDDNELKLKDWYNFTKQFGMTCEGVVS